MLISELQITHPAIFNRILECQREQGNKTPYLNSLCESKRGGNFDWNLTLEGQIFWEEISKDRFEVFYDRYRAFDFKLKADSEEFPTNWIIKRTPETANIINDWFINNNYGNPFDNGGYIWLRNDTHKYESDYNKPDGYIEITYEQFKKHLLKGLINYPYTPENSFSITKPMSKSNKMLPAILTKKSKKSKLITINK